MNGINNNVSNSNYGSLENNNSNAKKEEESIFDKILDTVSDFFGGDDEEEKDKPVVASNNLDKAYMLKLQATNTYTLAPSKEEESLTEKWSRENESVELKQKEKEIAKLQQNINSLRSKNKLLEKQNELIIQQTMASNQTSPAGTITTQSQDNTNQNINGMVQKDGTIVDEAKTYSSVPTHTSIPKEVLEQQQNEINELAASSKVEAPTHTIKEDDKKAQANSVEAKA